MRAVHHAHGCSGEFQSDGFVGIDADQCARSHQLIRGQHQIQARAANKNDRWIEIDAGSIQPNELVVQKGGMQMDLS